MPVTFWTSDQSCDTTGKGKVNRCINHERVSSGQSSFGNRQLSHDWLRDTAGAGTRCMSLLSSFTNRVNHDG